jgi:hypothetical protein
MRLFAMVAYCFIFGASSSASADPRLTDCGGVSQLVQDLGIIDRYSIDQAESWSYFSSRSPRSFAFNLGLFFPSDIHHPSRTMFEMRGKQGVLEVDGYFKSFVMYTVTPYLGPGTARASHVGDLTLVRIGLENDVSTPLAENGTLCLESEPPRDPKIMPAPRIHIYDQNGNLAAGIALQMYGERTN